MAVQSDVPVADNTGRPAGVDNPSLSTVVVTSSAPFSSVVGRVPPSAAERGKSVVVDEYESESDVDPDDVWMFEEDITHSMVRAGGAARMIEIPFDLNLLVQGDNLVPQLSLLCSEAVNGSLRNIPNAEVRDEVAVMGLRTYLLEMENIRRANIRSRIFLQMLGKYRRYRNRCRELHERLRTDPRNRALGEELERRDRELMQTIRTKSELEDQLRLKDEELELGKGVAAECEHLQGQLRETQLEVDRRRGQFEEASAEWRRKLSAMAGRVADLERIERAWSEALSRAATLEETIRVLQSQFDRQSDEMSKIGSKRSETCSSIKDKKGVKPANTT
nr:PREDICTED: uncharacterized protein LOC104219887 [Nicotiana sylvestris]